MAFYRIRHALRQLGYGDKITPAFNIRGLEHGRTKLNLGKLEDISGLDMPMAVSTRIGLFAALSGFVVIASIVFSLQPGFASALAGIIAGLAAAGVILHGDPGKLPPHCVTLADIAEAAAAMNYGRLVKLGARHRDEDIWDTLVEALPGYALPKPEITRETFFLKSQFQKRLAI